MSIFFAGTGVFNVMQNSYDGHKYFCYDDFADLDGRDGGGDGDGCLIYSFGLSTDTSFEEAMAEAGMLAGGRAAECVEHNYTYSSEMRSVAI